MNILFVVGAWHHIVGIEIEMVMDYLSCLVNVTVVANADLVFVFTIFLSAPLWAVIFAVS